MYKYELHTHTKECDKCANINAAEVVRMYFDAGYSGMVITDHYFSLFYEWFNDELKNMTHKEIINRWLKGYYEAKNEGEKIGFTVLPGAEVRFDGSINDYLVYGVDEDFFYNAPQLNMLKDVSELAENLPENAVIVQAHPFRDGMTVQNPSLLFGIEGYNGGTEMFRNNMAKSFAGYYEKKVTSGSDFHNKAALGLGGILTEKKILTPYDLISVLKSGKYSLIEEGRCKL